MEEKALETAVKVIGCSLVCSYNFDTSSLVAGDSGNPLMSYVNMKGRIKVVQMGIVVAGHSECGRGASGFPGIYSDMNYYTEWILDNLEE
jgi:secreted trypsin-like serine protease